jgi:fumarate reductase subunit D
MTISKDRQAATQRISHAPTFWLLFGAGGMLSALLGVGLLVLLCFALPLGWGNLALYQDPDKVKALLQHPLVALVILAFLVLFFWHAAHRLFKCLHDFGIHPSQVSKLACYGSALGLSVVSAWAVGCLYFV